MFPALSPAQRTVSSALAGLLLIVVCVKKPFGGRR